MDNKAELMAQAETLAQKLRSDPALAAAFRTDPAGTLRGLLGQDLPGDKLLALTGLLNRLQPAAAPDGAVQVDPAAAAAPGRLADAAKRAAMKKNKKF